MTTTTFLIFCVIVRVKERKMGTAYYYNQDSYIFTINCTYSTRTV